jgi:hypothetical protein
MVEMTEVKIAIIGIIVLEVSMGILAYFNKTSLDMGTIGMGITAIAGLAGFDMGTKKGTS